MPAGAVNGLSPTENACTFDAAAPTEAIVTAPLPVMDVLSTLIAASAPRSMTDRSMPVSPEMITPGICARSPVSELVKPAA